MIQAAMESWHRHDYQQYFNTMERACRLDPSNHGLLLDLGAGYGMRYDYASAERCFEKAVRVAPQKETALAMAGLHCRNFARHELARRYFERAIEQAGASADSFVKLAELYERFHFLDQAGRLVDRALEKDSHCALALLARARLDRVSGRLENAEGRIRPLLGNASLDTWSTRIRGWYELGAILDRQGRYDEAMAALVEAKALIRPQAGPYVTAQQSVQRLLKQAETDITEAVLRRWFEEGRALGPPRRLALLCGHPRSGTTLLEQVLDSHPDMTSAEETAIFFETYLLLKRGLPADTPMLSVLDPATPELLKEARGNYFGSMERFMGGSQRERLLIDKNPSLTALVPAMVRALPETRFLTALRDPRDVCLSCFMQPLPLNQTSAVFLTLEGTVEEYASIMGIWRAMAPRLPSPGLEVRYEDMVADLETVARRVLAFLGAPWDPGVLRFHEHAQKKLVRSPTYQDVTKPVFTGAVGRWRNYQKHLEPYLLKLEPFAKTFGYHV